MVAPPQEGPAITERAQQTLRNFCEWQRRYNDEDDRSDNHYDVAILLTRTDLCRAPGKCDTLGLAELGTMCDHSRSCAIIEDNGLSAAFTIAHELGHVFNLPHDDEDKCAPVMDPRNRNNYHIMAPTLEFNTQPWSWSQCSAKLLAVFLDNKERSHCLRDRPRDHTLESKMRELSAPGLVFDVDEQCKYVFGPSAKLCPYMPVCKRLWCATRYGYQVGCRTQHMPWAEGTPCGESHWCMKGHCVATPPDRLTPVDGGWGPWAAWADCSRSCGGGVRKAERRCDSPRPVNGGKYCIGERVMYESCRTNECSWEGPSFREQQCAAWDNDTAGVHGVPQNVVWVPKYDVEPSERCKLYCKVSSRESAFYKLHDKVADGTPCGPLTDDVCIDGECHSAGCDHRLGSRLRRDVCGRCNGEGGSCRLTEGSWNNRGNYGYNRVLDIPAGATNIVIEQHGHNNNKDDNNFLALQDSQGHWILNGAWQVSVYEMTVPVLGATLYYSGTDQVVENITSTNMKTKEILYLHILTVGKMYPPDIRYRFYEPVPHAGTEYRTVDGGGGGVPQVARYHVVDSTARGDPERDRQRNRLPASSTPYPRATTAHPRRAPPPTTTPYYRTPEPSTPPTAPDGRGRRGPTAAGAAAAVCARRRGDVIVRGRSTAASTA